MTSITETLKNHPFRTSLGLLAASAGICSGSPILTGFAVAATSIPYLRRHLSFAPIGTMLKTLFIGSLLFTAPGEAAGLSSCSYHPDEAHHLRDSVQQAALEGRLLSIEDASSGVYIASSGVYIAYDPDQAKIAIVKPENERELGPQNKRAARRGVDLSAEDQYQTNYYPGSSANRQFAARRLDFGSGACQPLGYIDELESDQFFSVEAQQAGHPAGIQRKKVFVQQFISDTTPLVELHPDFQKNPEKAYRFEGNPVLDQVPLEEFQRIALLDLLLFIEDRHPGNLLVSKDVLGNPHLIPIDMDMILPGTFKNTPWTGLFAHGRAKEGLTTEALHWLHELDPDQVASTVRAEGLAEPLARQAKMLALVLKELGSDHSIAEMSQFIFSKLPRLAEVSRENAIKSLSPSDLKNYQKSETIRRALWEKQPISTEDETWYRAYQTDSKKRIETSLEEKTFVYFKRGLQREASALRAKKTRHITFGTTYVAGNPDRDGLSELVSNNQQEYAQYWGLTGKVVTENLLLGQCKTDEHSVDCVPYWNKVAILKNWLNEPSSGKEEWYVLADDDMPVTNMNINPYEAIDLLRSGDDASIIIARDVVQWKTGNRDHSVNTGILIVRKDQKSREFIEKLWAKRNDAYSQTPHCRTLGTCKTQDVLHEQEAFARVLEEDPSLLNRVVKVVNYRDRYQGREIALNTFRRHGCFIRLQEGWKENEFSYNDPADGAWREGDWMGQTAGVPIVGKECGIGGASKFFRLDYLRWMLERTIPIDTQVFSSLTADADIHSPLMEEKATKTIADPRLTNDQRLLDPRLTNDQRLLDPRLTNDQRLLRSIKNSLELTKFKIPTFPNYGQRYWPEDTEAFVESVVEQIQDPETKIKAQQAVDEAWANYVKNQKVGNNGKSYLLKIKDPAIQEKARGYIDQALHGEISSLSQNRRFEEATNLLADIHSPSMKEEATKTIAAARLAYDQRLLQSIKNSLELTKFKNSNSPNYGQRYWPEDSEASVQSLVEQIHDVETKIKAQLAVDEAWATHIKDYKLGNNGKSFLLKIKDPAIQEKARGYIDQALHGEISSLSQNGRFEEATNLLADIHSLSMKEEATKTIAAARLAYDQRLLQSIKNSLEVTKFKIPTFPNYGQRYWPEDSEAFVLRLADQIQDPNTKKQAQRAIGEAWAKYILDENIDKETQLAKIQQESIRDIAREELERPLLEKVQSLASNKKFEQAREIVLQIKSNSVRKKAEQFLDESLLKRIKHILTKTRDNAKYDASKNLDCQDCYWPEDFEQTIEKMISQIFHPDVKKQAKKSVDQARLAHNKLMASTRRGPRARQGT